MRDAGAGANTSLKLMFLVVLCAGPARAQSNQKLNVFFTKEAAADPSRSVPVTRFLAGDALFLVIVGEGSLGDVASERTRDNGAKYWEVQLQFKVKGAKENDRGDFAIRLTEAEAERSSYACAIIPPDNDPSPKNQPQVEGLLTDLLSNGPTALVAATVKFYGNRDIGPSIEFDVSNPQNRYRDYAALFEAQHQRASAETRTTELAAEAKVPMPVDGMKDASLNKAMLALVQAELGTGFKVFRVIPRDVEWRYAKNQYGILTGRKLWDVWTAFQDLKSHECWLSRKWSVEESFISGDKFTKPSLVEDNTGRKQRWAEPCAKLGGKD